jgi:CubicO group peptidase (beta-lactamase class C family)
LRTYDTRLCPLVLSIGIAISLSACGGRDTASVQSVTEPCVEQRGISADMLVNLVGEPIALQDVETFFAARMQEMSVPGATVAIINQREIAYSRTVGVESS